MKCTLAPGIKSLSGKSGNLLFMTFKKPNGKTETRAYILPRDGSRYKRKSKPSKHELEVRALFARRQAYVQELLASGRYHSKAEAWKIAKQEIV